MIEIAKKNTTLNQRIKYKNKGDVSYNNHQRKKNSMYKHLINLTYNLPPYTSP